MGKKNKKKQTEHELKSNETSSFFSTSLPPSNKMVDSIMKSELKRKKFILITQIWDNTALLKQIYAMMKDVWDAKQHNNNM